MTFRPTLRATAAALAALAVLIGLGTWQLERRAWKRQLIENLAQRVSAPAASFADIAAAADPGAFEYRPIRLVGRFDDRRSIKLLNRTRAGRAGFHLVTPLQIDDAHIVVPVDRGWAPLDGATTLAPAPVGLVRVTGYVRRFATPGWFTPDNDPAAGAWFYLDRGQLAAALGGADIAPFYVQQGPAAGPPGSYPQGAVPEVALRNPHLQYALTWYALAVALLVIYVVFHVRRSAGAE